MHHWILSSSTAKIWKNTWEGQSSPQIVCMKLLRLGLVLTGTTINTCFLF
ncbi:unnamed protein product [Strongylus vulgaris]|uniref:Uncharacterized protein n=1 Tax=Strongylus vulgaris TaxID=40348 RepID=A0A3P7JY36_STRVU|nr:unnamed protein product [Strongylus vulgaris]